MQATTEVTAEVVEATEDKASGFFNSVGQTMKSVYNWFTGLFRGVAYLFKPTEEGENTVRPKGSVVVWEAAAVLGSFLFLFVPPLRGLVYAGTLWLALNIWAFSMTLMYVASALVAGITLAALILG
jgi:hypothetical protein